MGSLALPYDRLRKALLEDDVYLGTASGRNGGQAGTSPPGPRRGVPSRSRSTTGGAEDGTLAARDPSPWGPSWPRVRKRTMPCAEALLGGTPNLPKTQEEAGSCLFGPGEQQIDAGPQQNLIAPAAHTLSAAVTFVTFQRPLMSGVVTPVLRGNTKRRCAPGSTPAHFIPNICSFRSR